MRPRRLIAVVLCLLAFPAAAQAAPKVSIFYYPWYGNPALDGGWAHWIAPGAPTADVASSFYPARGLYSSSSPRIVRAQMREIAAAGVQEVVTSWWGWGSPEDLRLPLVIREAHAAGPLGRRPSRAVPRSHDRQHRGRHPPPEQMGITRFYVYRPFDLDASDWLELRSKIDGFQLFAQTSLAGQGGRRRVRRDLHVRHPPRSAGTCSRGSAPRPTASASSACPSVGPGYDATRATPDLRTKSRRDGKTYDCDVDGGDPVERRRRDDHELQRVARGDADRAGAPAAAARPPRRPTRTTPAPTG